MKCVRMLTDQHETSVGKRKNLSPRQELNSWMSSWTTGGHSIYWAVRTCEEQGHSTEFMCDTILCNLSFVCFGSSNNTIKVFSSTLKHFIQDHVSTKNQKNISKALQTFLGKHVLRHLQEENNSICSSVITQLWRNYLLRTLQVFART